MWSYKNSTTVHILKEGFSLFMRQDEAESFTKKNTGEELIKLIQNSGHAEYHKVPNERYGQDFSNDTP